MGPNDVPDRIRFVPISGIRNHVVQHSRLSSSVQLSCTVSQSLCCLFRRDIALWFGHHLVPDEELPDSGASQQGRVKVQMQMAGFDFLVGSFQGGLVDSHTCQLSALALIFWLEPPLTIREICLEQIVVSLGHVGNGLGQQLSLGL